MKRFKMYKVLPIVCLLIIILIVAKMYQAIPQGQAVPERKTVIEKQEFQSFKVVEGRYYVNARIASLLFGIGAIVGGILTYLMNVRLFNAMYQGSFKKYGEELRRQYRLRRLSGRDEEVDYDK